MIILVNGIILSILTPVATGLLGTLLGLLVKSWKNARSGDNATKQALRILLRAHLEDIYRASSGGTLPIEPDVKKDADETHEVYALMGGNGMGTMMWRKIIAAPESDRS